MKKLALAIAAGGLALGLATPAVAQPLACNSPNVFDPQCNHLKCYKIRGPSFAVSLRLDNQFGRERVFKLIPELLCTPTQKECCDAAGNCSPTNCAQDPSANQPAPVDHFKCYKIQVKQCTPTATAASFDCTKLTGRFPPAPPNIVVRLRDQFHVEDNVKVGPPRLLCVPVIKEVISPTTTVPVTTTTTTTRPCGGGGPGGACAGDCPTATDLCLFNRTTMSCDCLPPQAACSQQTAACNVGLCPDPNQQCVDIGGAPPCGCVP